MPGVLPPLARPRLQLIFMLSVVPISIGTAYSCLGLSPVHSLVLVSTSSTLYFSVCFALHELQRKGLPPPKLQTSFLYAKPSLTHQALLGLLQSGKLDYICSQNVDSLHLRSGVPRSQIAELHGNCFAERCKKCKKEYVRDFEMDTVSTSATAA